MRFGSVRVPRSVWVIGAAAVIGAGVFIANSRPTPVEVIPVRRQEAKSVLAVTGRIDPREEAIIASSASPSVVTQVLVDVGDRVKRGQLLIRLNEEELTAQLSQAQSELMQAEAELARAKAALDGRRVNARLAERSYNLSLDLAAARDQAREQVTTSQQRLRQAEARLARLRAGARPEDIRKAELSLEGARATLAERIRERDRQRELYAIGAVAKKAVDAAELAADTAKIAVGVAEKDLESLRTSRPEDIAEAQAARDEAQASVAAAQRTLATAEKNFRERLTLRTAKETAASDESVSSYALTAALLATDAKRARIRQIESQIAKLELRSPIDGVVARRNVNVGNTAATGVELLRVTTDADFRAVASIDEKFLPRIRVGQPVTITLESKPDRPLSGMMEQIGSEADANRGTVEVRVRITDRHVPLSADLTADLTIITAVYPDAVIVPTSAVRRTEDSFSVFTIQNGIVASLPVTVKDTTPAGVVVEGPEVGGEILRDARAVSPGTRVVPRRSKD